MLNCFCLKHHVYLSNVWPILFVSLCAEQKHDIIKRRLDSHGNTIEARQEGIGATKVWFPVFS